MKRPVEIIIAVLLVWHGCVTAAEPTTKPTDGKIGAYVVVFDFHTEGIRDTGTSATPLSKRPIGVQIADSVRLRLRRRGYRVSDRLTTQELSRPLPISTDAGKAAKLMTDSLGANIGIYGTVSKQGKKIRAKIRCIDLTDPKKPTGWTKTFSDDTERARGVIATAIVEAVRGKAEWVPPQYGDEPEPKNFGKPLNKNGDFGNGRAGWDHPDNVSTFIEDGPGIRGKILRVRTDLARDPWLKYRRALRMGKADPNKPPKIARDKSYNCVGALEGVHYRGEFLKAAPGQRYWLTADVNAKSAGMFFPKVFVKGFRRTAHAFDGLPESSLAELGMTPEQFAELPEAKRKKLIRRDAAKNPMRYLRECYRWYLACRSKQGKWMHFAAPFPPRGGLPKYVEYIQIQIYSYWPPGEYLWDNVHLYKDPRQTAPLPEVKPRTPNPPERGK